MFPIQINGLLPQAKPIVDRVIKRWGREDLNNLLDYVYCYTEPMKDAQLREVLDFHKIPRHIRRALSDKRELSKEDKENIKELIKVNGTVSRKPISLKVQKESLTTEKDVPLIPNLRGKIKCERDYIKTIEGVE